MKLLIHSLPVVVCAIVFLLPPVSAPARGQAMCTGEHDSLASACYIGMPDALGITLRDVLDYPGQVHAYNFRVGPDASTVYVYLGDQWYDLDVVLRRDPPNEAELSRSLLVAESQTFEPRVVQFVQPEIIVQHLDAGSYTLFVQASDPRRFDPSRGFTVRVALGPPICETQRDAAGVYQLALTYQPTQPTEFSLMSFGAFLSPPYSDLFDFEWQIDGQRVPGNPREIAQTAVPDLSNVPDNEHHVRVTARGVREYPDPDPRYRHTPPTLSVECTFTTP